MCPVALFADYFLISLCTLFVFTSAASIAPRSWSPQSCPRHAHLQNFTFVEIWSRVKYSSDPRIHEQIHKLNLQKQVTFLLVVTLTLTFLPMRNDRINFHQEQTSSP